MKRLWMLSLAAALGLALAGCARHAPINPYDENAGYLVIEGELAYTGDEIAYGATVTQDPAYLNSPGQYTFSIRTTGTPIRLTGDPLVAIEADSEEESAFSVAQQPEASLGSGDVTQFVIEFAPSAVGVQSATVTIEVNDRPEVAFTFDVEAEGRASAILIEEGDVEYASGGTYDFGSLPLGVMHSVLLTIRNNAAYAVELTGDPVVAITGDDADAFTVIDGPSGTELSSGGSAAFTLGFTPSAESVQSATLSIETDGRADFPFTLQLEAEGSGSAIAIEEGTTEYLSGATYHFGSPPPGGTHTTTLRIRNNADDDIALTGDPVVQITGQDAAAFTVTDEPDSTELRSGYSTEFTIEFAPTETGTCAAVLSIEIGGVTAAYVLDLAGMLSGAVFVDTAGDTGYYASMACAGSNVWISYNDNNNEDLHVATSTDYGTSWSTTTVDSAGNVGWHTSVYADGSNVYVAYFDSTNNDVKVARSVDSGASWPSGSIAVVDSSALDGYPDIVMNGATGCISFDAGGSVKVARTVDSASSWASQLISYNGDYESSLTISGSNVYLTYYDDSNDDLCFAKSLDAGESFTVFTDIATSGFVGRHTCLEIESGDLFVSYYSSSPTIQFARSTDDGVTWSAQTIHELTSYGAPTSLCVVGDTLRVCFPDDGALLVTTSTDRGVTWGDAVTVISSGVAVGSSASIAAVGDYVYLCYRDTREGDLGFVASSDGGETWW